MSYLRDNWFLECERQIQEAYIEEIEKKLNDIDIKKACLLLAGFIDSSDNNNGYPHVIRPKTRSTATEERAVSIS
ncbi:MAG: hypothetical protein JSV50_01235 [Desulfobacteraceae bacterium]|jgi:hypothetical protein|nr:MAG: hypothetical protein JSV50_01235 [Desulfobacteraceae bacterium]